MPGTITVMSNLTQNSEVKVGATIVASFDDRRIGTIVTEQSLRCPDGVFVINTGTADQPWFTFGMLTGRTRQRWGMAMPTIARFECDTVVIDGAIWGVPGKRIDGTFLIRPEYVVTP
jgi:hypothetical protein